MLTPNLETISRIMRQETDRAHRDRKPGQMAQTPVFCFQPNEVAGIYTHKNGAGMGLWFRLKDGRVFDSSGKTAEDDPALYGESGAEQPPVIAMERPRNT
jgi:hypothetical protein